MSILEVRNLTHIYRDNPSSLHCAVDGVSFCAEKGEIIGIIGHTGSGKSTLVQHFNGLLKPTEGEVLFEGENIWRNPKEIRKYRARVGLVFQYPEYQLFEETVFKDIAFGPKNMGLSESEIEERVKETCQWIEIKESFLQKSPFDLSGGEKRRVAIAGVLAMKPEIIVFDEPTAGLDPAGREIVMRAIKKYRDSQNATVIIISHSMEDMAEMADRLLVMEKGKVVMFDTTRKVFQNAEKLREIGLNIPIVARVFEKLKESGVPVPDGVLTLENAVEALTALKRGGQHA